MENLFSHIFDTIHIMLLTTITNKTVEQLRAPHIIMYARVVKN